MRQARWIIPAAAAAAIASILWLERKRPLRARVEPAGRRAVRNLALALAGGLTLQIAQRPVVDRLARLAERRRWGVLQRMSLPPWLFHHSNVRLPLWLERRLVWVIVTPRMHGIHHSIIEAIFSHGRSVQDDALSVAATPSVLTPATRLLTVRTGSTCATFQRERRSTW